MQDLELKKELFQNNPEQLKLLTLNETILKSVGMDSFIDLCFGYMIPSLDVSNSGALERGKIKVANKLQLIKEFHKNITIQIKAKGYENDNNYVLAINLKGYINALANNESTKDFENYFLSCQESPNLNVLDKTAWINEYDNSFYSLCEQLQNNYQRDVKTLTIIEFYTRLLFLKKNRNGKTI